MNNDIIKLARQAGFQTGIVNSQDGTGSMPFIRPLVDGNCLVEVERMVRAAQAAEREECLKCYFPDDTATDWADKIRARGKA